MISPQPVAPAQRIASLDALRGLALCGILLINIFQMGGPIAMDRPLSAPALGEPDWQVWTIAKLFVTGTMRGLFSLLFGVGLLLFVGDMDDADRTRLYLRRLMLLLLFGIIDCTLLLWPGDILITYAAAGFVVLVLHTLRPSGLVAAAATALLLVSVWDGVTALTIQPSQTVYTAKMIAREGAARLGGYSETLEYMSYVSWSWTVNALSYRSVADTAGMMLIGMALYRTGMFGERGTNRIMIRTMAVGYGIGLVLRLVHVTLIWANDGGPTFISALVDQPGRVAMTIGHFALFQLFWRRNAAPRIKTLFANMGRMALTLYLGQSLIAAFIFSGFGMGLWNSLSWAQLCLVALAILAVEALFATLWFSVYRYGPAEWLWRWGTYGRRLAMR